MTNMTYFIVYSQRTGRVRRAFKFDPGTGHCNPAAGEGVITSDGADLPAWQAAVTAHTGLTPSGDLYDVVHPELGVVGRVCADPDCGDAIPGHTLVQT